MLDGITDAMDIYLGKLREMVRDREAWHAAVMGAGHDWVTEQHTHTYACVCMYLCARTCTKCACIRLRACVCMHVHM